MTRRPISKGLRFDVLNRDGFRCRYCGAGTDTATLHIDHQTPVALGGTNDFDNLVTACVACNLGKATKLATLDADLDYEGVDCPFAEGWPQDIEDPVFYLNEEWAVTSYGLERLKKFYPIPKERLDEAAYGTPSISMWIDHMSSKLWVLRKPDDFLAAFLKAVRVHVRNPSFDLDASLNRFRAKISRFQENEEYRRQLKEDEQ